MRLITIVVTLIMLPIFLSGETMLPVWGNEAAHIKQPISAIKTQTSCIKQFEVTWRNKKPLFLGSRLGTGFDLTPVKCSDSPIQTLDSCAWVDCGSEIGSCPEISSPIECQWIHRIWGWICKPKVCQGEPE